MSRTLALHLKDESLRAHTTRVVSIQPITALSEASRALFKQAAEGDLVVVTAETIFYAQGGGQPSDTGYMSSTKPDKPATFAVSSVRHGPDGEILHLGRYTTSDALVFAAGDEVHQVIDAEKRDLNSRVHTGGHIIGLAVHHFSETIPDVVELKAQHYPDSAFVEFKGLIDGKHKEAIQAKANELVKRALPVTIRWLTKAEIIERCVAVPEGVSLPEDELLRAVDIEGAGAYPCGGTQVRDSSQVGTLTVKKISRQKGHSKVSYTVS